MNEHSTIISGFGGQGVILAGKTLARAGMELDLKVTWLPSYGPEMRGGTANCTVIISPELIGSPIVDEPNCLLAFNKPSLEKFGPQIKKDGSIIVNSSLIEESELTDELTSQVQLARIPLNDIANQLGNPKVINMVALGAWAGITGYLKLEDVKQGMKLTLKSRGKDQFIPVNSRALDKGYEQVKTGSK